MTRQQHGRQAFDGEAAMQSQVIIIDLRLLNAKHRVSVVAPASSDYVSKLIPSARSRRTRAAPTDASSVWEEWLAVPSDRPSRRSDFDA
jgi:hypothetical protein